MQNNKPKYRDKKWLFRQYHGKEKSTSEIANECDCSQPTILRWLQKFNIPTRSRGKPRNRVKLICKYCKEPFWIKKSRSDQKFCSQECYSRSNKTTKTCENCGNKIDLSNSEAKDRRFCSRKCAAEWHGRQMKIWENKDEYKKAKKEAPGNLKENKERARERDNRTCQFCGKVEKNGEYDSYKIPTHHIKPIREGGTNHIGNLITLCDSCHNRLEQYILDAKWKQEV